MNDHDFVNSEVNFMTCQDLSTKLNLTILLQSQKTKTKKQRVQGSARAPPTEWVITHWARQWALSPLPEKKKKKIKGRGAAHTSPCSGPLSHASR